MLEVIEVSDEDDDCIIESVMYAEDSRSNENYPIVYHEAYRENKLLAELIKKSLCLENTKDMINILKDLFTQYKEAVKLKDKCFFRKSLKRAINLLQIEPHRKFSHIKDLCNIFKKHKVKKKVPFITVETNLKDKTTQPHQTLKRGNIEEIDSLSAISSKKSKIHSTTTSQFNETRSNYYCFDDTTNTLDESMGIENCSQESGISEEDKLLIPTDAKIYPDIHTEMKIKSLERKIAHYKKQISILDNLEVDDDSVNSPYIKSERFKLAIVTLYKELCELVGSQPVKRKEIRLKVSAGHPPGPTRLLEDFLNRNIGTDGQIPFPDFFDVVTCVTEANEKDDLGWTKAQIMNEASLLFTTCGRTLQRRRQRLEYRDLLHTARLEPSGRDPADGDPALLARLEENRRIAIKKESEIIERYAMMQSLPQKPKNGLDSEKKTDTTPNDSVNIDSSTHNTNSNNEKEKNESSTAGEIRINDDAPSEFTLETVRSKADTQNKEQLIEFENKCDNAQKLNNNNNICNDKECNESDSIVNGASNKVENDSCVKSDICNGTKQVPDLQETISNLSENKTSTEELSEAQVKQEPQDDVIKMLESLGDNYTLTVEDIDISYNWVHPCITIEISSDSSDEE